MAVAAPKRSTAPAPAPSRTTAPKRRKAAAPATAPNRRKPASARAVAVPSRAPARRAPARAPQRARPKPRRNPGARVIPLAVAVSQLPDSGLMVRMTRGRAWIAVLGVLLVGIVALNVVTLSVAASAGKIDEQITALEEENNVLSNRDARLSGVGPVRAAAETIGLSQPSSETIKFVDVTPDDVATAAARLAAAGP